ncbi:hypothetical protein M405DRAFT_835694 [Rhizopogon salebrosus TDB-379]|nr:hypothetical protein M405DRAFT_835694 [Rhizopogon salebrosus TDB-379]
MISDFKKLDEYQRIEASFSNGGEVGLRHLLKSHFEYAMLSHRWNDTETTKEPTYAFIKSAQDKGQNIYDMKEQFSNGKDRGENMRKLRSFCYTAAKCGFRWAWSDTCCINKASRIEEEASINSMFKWYSNSALTIVYLRDVVDVSPISRLGLHTSNSVHDFVAKYHAGSQKAPILQYAQEQHAEEFVDTQVDENALENLLKQYFPVFDGKSSPRPEWCVRCWTLPEMVASRHLRFYCKTWKALEPASYPRASRTKRFSDHRQSLLWQGALSRSTGVDAENLLHFKPGMMNVREKLHWASRREATRDEDLAYSLLGLFGIKMSVIYGEGLDAFVRLQEEIMKRTDDLSIFDFSGAVSGVNSCLAFSPSCYSEGPLERMERKMTLGRFFGGALSVLGAVTPALFDRFKTFLESNSGLPSGHSLENGTITVSVFEHKVKLEKIATRKYKYRAKTNGLSQTEFTTLEPLKLEDGPAYYLIRVYDRQVRRAIEIFASHAMYWIKDKLDQGLVGREEDRERARGFLEDPFVVYLMARDGVSCRRVATKSRIIVHYRAYRFSQAVRRRTLT